MGILGSLGVFSGCAEVPGVVFEFSEVLGFRRFSAPGSVRGRDGVAAGRWVRCRRQLGALPQTVSCSPIFGALP